LTKSRAGSIPALRTKLQMMARDLGPFLLPKNLTTSKTSVV